jgi:cyclophilin family peptidyl-prolyl cis-trans isomerase
MVEFTLSFPISMSTDGPTTFTVELAPVTDMPHTVVTFLDLVHLQLFDGTAFVSANSQQIEGGSPNNADVSRSVKLYETYARYGYTRTPLGFNEYSEKHPHAPFTIGFVGYPHAGPGLAINMADNTKSRGPDSDGMGGQPCFGTIVSGFDTLTRIQAAPRSVDGYRFAKNVEIKSVRLVNVANHFVT